ncbi:hypothetical protein ABT369_26165 [Dactylosporangium sp. NPDC000244]|uniref:hypothetical protein n=1 Tax=Dactylosporangium sp. NPDC000244 TaxID=3154365 RepID=UPI00332FED4B
MIHTIAAERGGGVIAGVFRDGGRPIGLAGARVHGLGRRRVLGGVADVEHPAIGALPGLGLPDGLPGTLDPAGRPGPQLLGEAVLAFERAVRAEFGPRVPAIAYRQVYRDELPVFLPGVTLVRAGAPVAVLRNRGGGYEGYLGTLSKSRRGDQRRLLRRIDADPDTVVWFGPREEARVDLAEMHRLSADAARRNHTVRWPPLRMWSPRLFETMMALPEVRVLTYREPGGALIAATAMFDHPVAPLLGPWAAPPLGDRRTGLWFDQFSRQLRFLLDAGRPMVLAGKGAREAKESLGFTFEPQWTVLRRIRRV